MARSGTGNNSCSNFGAKFAAGTAATWSLHFRVKGNAPSGGFSATAHLREQGTTASVIDSGFYLDHSAGAFQKAGYQKAALTYVAAKTTSSVSTGVWYYIGVTYDGTNLRTYKDGTLEATAASGAVDPAWPYYLNILSSDSSTFGANNTMCEVGFWAGAVLTADDMAGLAQDFSPQRYRLDKLALYAPLLVDARNLIGGPLGDSGTPAYVDHPRTMG